VPPEALTADGSATLKTELVASVDGTKVPLAPEKYEPAEVQLAVELTLYELPALPNLSTFRIRTGQSPVESLRLTITISGGIVKLWLTERPATPVPV
jgi:hypothetical protein